MTDFKDVQQSRTFPISFFPAPIISSMGVNERQNVSTQGNFVATGYLQQAQNRYPLIGFPNSPVYAVSQDNLNQRSQAFHGNYQTQNTMWVPNIASFQSAPNLASPVTLTGYFVTNPQFLQNSDNNQANHLVANTGNTVNQMFAPSNSLPRHALLDDGNTGYHPQHMWLLQQHDQLMQNNQQLSYHRQQHQQEHLQQQHQQEHLQQQHHQQQHQQEHLQQQHQQEHLQQQHHQQQQHQQEHLQQQHHHQQQHQQEHLQQQHHQQQHYHQQLQPNADLKDSGQSSPIRNVTYHLTQNNIGIKNKEISTLTNANFIHASQDLSITTKMNDTLADISPGTARHDVLAGSHLKTPRYDTSADSHFGTPKHDTSADTHYGGSDNSRPKALSSSLPTTLNPSLQIKPPLRLNEPIPLHNWDEKNSASSHTLNEAHITDQTTFNESGSQMRRHDSLKIVLKPVYERPMNKDTCIRCSTKVYPMERTGPIKEVIYHKRCFTCVSCGTTLNLKNFHHNPNDTNDLQVFCVSHKPKDKSNSCNANAVLIKSAMAAPRLDMVNEQIRTDRQPSEVLTRSGCSLPAASALSETRESFYYGMAVKDNMTPNTIQKPNSQENIGKENLQHMEEVHQQFQQQQVLHQHLQHPQNECDGKNSHSSPQHQHQLQELIGQNMQQLSDINHHDWQELADDMANMTIPTHDKTLLTPIDIPDNKASSSKDQSSLPQTENGDEQKSFSVMKSQESDTGVQLDQAIGLTPDKNKTLQLETRAVCQTNDEHKKVTNLESFRSASLKSTPSVRVHYSSSLIDNVEGHDNSFSRNLNRQETRSISSDMSSHDRHFTDKNSIHASSIERCSIDRSSIDKNSSDRSSISSDVSSRERGSVSSDLSSHERAELEAIEASQIEDQSVLSVQGGRADRPSMFQNNRGQEAPKQKRPRARMMDENTSNYNLVTAQNRASLDRFLPKNERMRLDRPSQYS